MLILSVFGFVLGDITVSDVTTALMIVLILMTLYGVICTKLMDRKEKTQDKEKNTQRQEASPRPVVRVKDPDDDDFENSELVRQLLALDDVQLTQIIENPLFYKDNCIRKARSILGRRRAWENIKNLTDGELMEMLMVTVHEGKYDENLVGAASMELYQRDSQLLYDEIHGKSWAVIKNIANGTLSAPEGVRLAAQKYLSKD